MAEETSPNTNDNQQQPETADQAQSQEPRLIYFEFVQAVTLYALICTAELYSYGKEISGPLRPVVKTVEFTVKTVAGPVYNMIRPLPGKALVLVDRKVDESVHKIAEHVPPSVKEALVDAQTAISLVRSLVRTLGGGLGLAKSTYTTYEPTAKGMYDKYAVAQQYATSASRSLKSLVPLVPEAARAVAPTASYLSEKYNQTVQVGAEKGYKVASYLPLVPTAKIAELLSIPTPVETS